MNMEKAKRPVKIINARYLTGIRPTNIRLKAVTKTMTAVEKLAGRIRAQVTIIARDILPKTPLKSLILFWLTERIFATYITRAILAKSDG